MSLHLVGLHPHMGCHVILDSSAGQARVTPKVLWVIKVLQGVPSQSISRLPVQWLPLLGWIDQWAPLRLWRVGGQICLHVVFGEGKARPGDPIRAGAAETGQRCWTGCVLVIVMWTKHFDGVPVMETFRGEVNAWSPRAAAHHARHGELGVVGQ